jgi:hypothetical protein
MPEEIEYYNDELFNFLPAMREGRGELSALRHAAAA